jgi:hypothetical protein
MTRKIVVDMQQLIDRTIAELRGGADRAVLTLEFNERGDFRPAPNADGVGPSAVYIAKFSLLALAVLAYHPAVADAAPDEIKEAFKLVASAVWQADEQRDCGNN